MMWQYAHNLRYRRHFQRCPNNEYKIYKVPIVIHQSIVEGRRKILAKECDIRLHDPCNGDIVILIIRTILVALPFLPRARRPIRASLSLQTWFGLSYRPNTSIATRYPSGLQFIIYFFTSDSVFALDTCGGGEGSVTLNQLFGKYSSMTFKIVDVLCEIRQKLVLVL